MTFPIHPNNYNSLLPAPHQTEELTVFSEGIRRVRLLRGAQFECVTLALVWIDIVLVTHQIVLDYSLSARNVSGGDSNLRDWEAVAFPEFRSDHPALTHQASMALFITITTVSFAFLLEGIVRNIYSRVTQRRFCAVNVSDVILCAVSFGLNISLLIARVSPLARDFVALLIVFRLLRMVTLVGGLTQFEKKQIVRMLDGYRREEGFNSEHQRMLQTELENRTKECQDLRDLIKSATLSRNKLKQKQQLQVKQVGQEQQDGEEVSTVSPKRGVGGGQDDSGHSSDSGPETPLEAFGRVPTDGAESGVGAVGNDGGGSSGGAGTPSDIELTSVSFVTAGGDTLEDKSITSRM